MGNVPKHVNNSSSVEHNTNMEEDRQKGSIKRQRIENAAEGKNENVEQEIGSAVVEAQLDSNVEPVQHVDCVQEEQQPQDVVDNVKQSQYEEHTKQQQKVDSSEKLAEVVTQSNGGTVEHGTASTRNEIGSESIPDCAGQVDDATDRTIIESCRDENSQGELSHDSPMVQSNAASTSDTSSLVCVPHQNLFETATVPATMQVKCPNCLRKVGATRFAPHLEKCVNRGRGAAPSSKRDNRTTDTNTYTETTEQVQESATVSVENDPSHSSVVTDVGLTPTCLKCKRSDWSNNTILCDSCDRCFHIWCLSPRLQALPSDKPWFCSKCAPRMREINLKGKFVGRMAPLKLKRGCFCSGFEAMEFYCDLCSERITTMRWRCLVCYNFDCCLKCYESGKTVGVHSSSKHSMAKIEIE